MNARVEKFNELVGYIFSDLYENFPVAVGIDYLTMANRLQVYSEPYKPDDSIMRLTVRTRSYGEVIAGVDFEEFIDNTVGFLINEGFVSNEKRTGELRLTSKSLVILDAPMEGLGISRASKLHEAVKDAGQQAGRTAVSEVVGSIIGAAVKGMLS